MIAALEDVTDDFCVGAMKPEHEVVDDTRCIKHAVARYARLTEPDARPTWTSGHLISA